MLVHLDHCWLRNEEVQLVFFLACTYAMCLNLSCIGTGATVSVSESNVAVGYLCWQTKEGTWGLVNLNLFQMKQGQVALIINNVLANHSKNKIK